MGISPGLDDCSQAKCVGGGIIDTHTVRMSCDEGLWSHCRLMGSQEGITQPIELQRWKELGFGDCWFCCVLSVVFQQALEIRSRDEDLI